MSTGIKHTIAGPLNILVCGRTPEPEVLPKRRSAKSQPTSPTMQFYNDKCSWRELEQYIAANFCSKDIVVTLTVDDEHLPASRTEARSVIQKFFRALRTARKRRNEELRYIYVIEHLHGAESDHYFGDDRELEHKRIHYHVILNSVSMDDYEEIHSLWRFGGYLRAEPLDMHYTKELAKYMTKEAREFGRTVPGERTWCVSRNLKKAEVSYYDGLPDGVSLTPPEGAVNVEYFSVKNPYGFGDCIGIRYLLFGRKVEPDYSYTHGRGPSRKPSNNFQT